MFMNRGKIGQCTLPGRGAEMDKEKILLRAGRNPTGGE
jgi:hypothetical protein